MTSERDTLNMEMRAFHSELAVQVLRLHRNRCPCCGHVMVKPRKQNKTSQHRRDRRTIAHDTAKAVGGDPTAWVYACYGCNRDQGLLSFRQWSLRLAREGDRRAPLVAALADTVQQFKDAKHAKPTRTGDSRAQSAGSFPHLFGD